MLQSRLTPDNHARSLTATKLQLLPAVADHTVYLSTGQLFRRHVLQRVFDTRLNGRTGMEVARSQQCRDQSWFPSFADLSEEQRTRASDPLRHPTSGHECAFPHLRVLTSPLHLRDESTQGCRLGHRAPTTR